MSAIDAVDGSITAPQLSWVFPGGVPETPQLAPLPGDRREAVQRRARIAIRCPLRSESDRIAAWPRNDAMCQYRTHAAQQDCSAVLDHIIRSNPSPTRRTFVTLGTKKCVGAIAQPSSAQRTRNARRDTAASSGISQNPVFTSGSSTCNG